MRLRHDPRHACAPTRLNPSVGPRRFHHARRHGRSDAPPRRIAPRARERKHIGGGPGVPLVARRSTAPRSEMAGETRQEDDRPPRRRSSRSLGRANPQRTIRGIGHGETRRRRRHRSNDHPPRDGVGEHMVQRQILVRARRRQRRGHSRLRSGPCRLGEEVLASSAPVRRGSSLRDPLRGAWKLVDEDPDRLRWVPALGAVCVARHDAPGISIRSSTSPVQCSAIAGRDGSARDSPSGTCMASFTGVGVSPRVGWHRTQSPERGPGDHPTAAHAEHCTLAGDSTRHRG